MTGRELKAIIDNCSLDLPTSDCINCKLYRTNSKIKCPKEHKTKWQEWASKQRMEFDTRINEK